MSAGLTFAQSSRVHRAPTIAGCVDFPALAFMHFDIASLLLAMTVCMVTMAIALPAVMGEVDAPARCAQAGVILQGVAWALLLTSGLVAPGSITDRALSTLAMAGITGGLALNAAAFDLWCGRTPQIRIPLLIAVVMPVGYSIGFSSYSFRVGWANGLLTLQMAFLVASVWRKPAVPVGKWRWLLAVSVIAQMIVTLGRGVLGAFFTASYPSFLAPHPVNYAFALIANATTVLSLMAVLLAHRDEAARELERLATVDGLTGVLNRRAWLSLATTEMAVSVRYGHPVAVLMIDLDHFKQINDTHGHSVGDAVLKEVAYLLRKQLRAFDLAYRLGGEEFLILLPGSDLTHAEDLAERLRARVGSEQVAGGIPVTMSFGVGASEADETFDYPAVFARADAALYRAKSRGRDRVCRAEREIAVPALA
jgi:diguanylate cyclase (GGDEF)-like protein